MVTYFGSVILNQHWMDDRIVNMTDAQKNRIERKLRDLRRRDLQLETALWRLRCCRKTLAQQKFHDDICKFIHRACLPLLREAIVSYGLKRPGWNTYTATRYSRIL